MLRSETVARKQRLVSIVEKFFFRPQQRFVISNCTVKLYMQKMFSAE
jgi:hypothetical protein